MHNQTVSILIAQRQQTTGADVVHVQWWLPACCLNVGCDQLKRIPQACSYITAMEPAKGAVD